MRQQLLDAVPSNRVLLKRIGDEVYSEAGEGVGVVDLRCAIDDAAQRLLVGVLKAVHVSTMQYRRVQAGEGVRRADLALCS